MSTSLYPVRRAWAATRAALAPVVPWLAITGIVYLISQYNYLFFHSLTELFSIAVSIAIFMLVWNTRQYHSNLFFFWLGLSGLFASLIDLLHMLTYKGMGILPGNDPNLPTQLWIAARYLQSLAFLAAPWFIGHQIRAERLTLILLTAFVVLVGAISLGWFPASYHNGLTPFKILSEYMISLIWIAAIVWLMRYQSAFTGQVFGFVVTAAAFYILAELAFTFYVSVYGLSNFVGHLFRIIATYYQYLAIVELGLKQPFSVLFLDRQKRAEALQDSEEKYRRLVDLSPDLIAVHQDSLILYINPAGLALIGVRSPDDVIGQSIWNYLPAGELTITRTDGSIRKVDRVDIPFNYRGQPAIQTIARDTTDRQRAEEALRSSEANLRAIVEASPVPLALNNEQYHVTLLNPAFVNAFGYQHDDIPTLADWWRAAYPDTGYRQSVAAAWRAELERSRQTRTAFIPMEVRICCKDGRVKTVLAHAAPLPESLAGHHLVVLYDITARKEAEEAVAASDVFLKGVLNSLVAHIAVLDEQGTVIAVNEAWRRFAGANGCQDAAAYVGTNYFAICEAARQTGDRDAQTVLDGLQAVREGCQTAFAHKYQCATPLQVHWYQMTVLPQHEPRSGLIVIHQDITDQQRAEQILAEERERLRAILASSQDGLALLGTDGAVYVVNQALLALLELPGIPNDWEGQLITNARPFYRTLGIEADIKAEIRRLRRGSTAVHQGEWQLRTRTLRWSTLPVFHDTQVTGILIVLHDITEEKHLAALREDLTHAVVHDLRNPLTSIQGALQIIQLEESNHVSPGQQEMLGVIEGAAQTMLALVTSILSVERLEAGQMPLERETVDLNSLIVEGVQLQEPIARMRQVTLTLELTQPAVPVLVDAGLIRRVIQNLLGNALKFTAAGGEIHLRIQPGSGAVQVSIQDNGPGIAPDLQSRLFQKFVAGHGPNHGSGLGLAFCRLVVEAHGGRIWVDSEPGRGATFSFTVATEEQ